MGKALPRPAPRRPPPTAAPTTPAPRVNPAAADAFVRGVMDDDSHPLPATRAPAGTRALVERRDGRTRRKLMVYLAPETFEALQAHCRAEGRELSHTVDAALRAFLNLPR